MFAEENGEFILNYWSSQISCFRVRVPSWLKNKKTAEIICKVADDKIVNLVDEILEPGPKKVTKERNRSANANPPQTNSTLTLKEVKHFWNAVEDIQARGVSESMDGCMIKIFWWAGLVTPSNPPLPINNFCLYLLSVFRCFCKDPLMTPTPTTPLQASFTTTPSPSTKTPPPLKILIIHRTGCAILALEFILKNLIFS